MRIDKVDLDNGHRGLTGLVYEKGQLSPSLFYPYKKFCDPFLFSVLFFFLPKTFWRHVKKFYIFVPLYI